MSRLARDGTAEPVSLDQILRHARGHGDILFPVQLTTSRIGSLTRLIHTLLYVMTIHTYIHRIPELLQKYSRVREGNISGSNVAFTKYSSSRAAAFSTHKLCSFRRHQIYVRTGDKTQILFA